MFKITYQKAGSGPGNGLVDKSAWSVSIRAWVRIPSTHVEELGMAACSRDWGAPAHKKNDTETYISYESAVDSLDLFLTSS